MNDFSYYNLFETKGMEYLITILFLALLIPFWLILNRRRRAPVTQEVTQAPFKLLEKSVPAGILFHKNHTWVHLGRSGKVKLGLSELLLHLTKDIEIHPLLQEGDTITKGDALMKIGTQNKHLTILSPVSGTLGKRNTGSLTRPEQLLTDPYGKGWLMEIEPSNWLEEIRRFHLANKAENWLNKELDRVKHFFTQAMQQHQNEARHLVMQDGGELMDHPLDRMPESTWAEFQQEFLNK